MNPVISPIGTADPPGWPAAGLFLEALSRRDFAALGGCLDPDVRFRALVPPGPFELSGAAATAECFARWFGGPDDDAELVDASIGQVGSRLYLRWRMRIVPTDAQYPVRVVEQHAFASAGQAIERLDLLCSGFHTETASPRAAEGAS